MLLLNHMGTQGKVLWETIIGREPENKKKSDIVYVFTSCLYVVLLLCSFRDSFNSLLRCWSSSLSPNTLAISICELMVDLLSQSIRSCFQSSHSNFALRQMSSVAPTIGFLVEPLYPFG